MASDAQHAMEGSTVPVRVLKWLAGRAEKTCSDVRLSLVREERAFVAHGANSFWLCGRQG